METTVIFRTAAAILAVSAMPHMAAFADHSITIESVKQRFPWNNKLDIRYTVTGGQDIGNGLYCKAVFTADIGGKTYTIDGTTNLYAAANAGTHTATWTIPDGIEATDCTMSAKLIETDFPSGDDYMIVNLTTGTVTYEGMVSQTDSNERYNTDAYKTSLMALRKVPKTANSSYPGGYRTGHASWSNQNTPTNWITQLDYYIGVFPVTQQQYQNIRGSNPSGCKSAKTDGLTGKTNVVGHRPVETVSWQDLRGSASPDEALTPNQSGTFFERLNHLTKTGASITGFDLPTEVMFEIAERANVSTAYFYGSDTLIDDNFVCKANANSSTVSVGFRIPNAWGLFDVSGNVYEWVLDDNSRANIARAPDPFTPAWGGSSTKRMTRGGGPYANPTSYGNFHASFRKMDNVPLEANTQQNWLGFRVAYIVKE